MSLVHFEVPGEVRGKVYAARPCLVVELEDLAEVGGGGGA